MKPAFVRNAVLLGLAAAAAACRPAGTPHAEPEEAETGAAAAHEERPDRVSLSAAALSEAGVVTWDVKPVDLEHLLVLNGTVGHDEDRLLHVAANVRGRVESIPVDLGARVREGDPLVVLESVELGKARAELVRESASLRVASRAYEREFRRHEECVREHEEDHSPETPDRGAETQMLSFHAETTSPADRPDRSRMP